MNDFSRVLTREPCGSDANSDANLEFSIVTAPNNGTVALVEGQWLYTPEANFNGSDSFAYQVSDGVNASTATITVAVASQKLEIIVCLWFQHI